MADKLNLRPSERRLLVVVGLVVFVVVNIWMVWPRFDDLSQAQFKRAQALKKLERYNEEISKKPAREAEVERLLSAGGKVAGEDQAIELLYAIRKEALAHRVGITGNSRMTTRTNEFFIEQSQNITTMSGESNLVNFLYELGSGNSTIRVRELRVQPEPQRYQLSANIKLVSSYRLADKTAGKPKPPETAKQ